MAESFGRKSLEASEEQSNYGIDLHHGIVQHLKCAEQCLQTADSVLRKGSYPKLLGKFAIFLENKGAVCTIEISATLANGEIPKDKHEIISQRGIACDVVVDAQLKQDSVYVFGTENKKFTDVDFELYGLSIEEIIYNDGYLRTRYNQAIEYLEKGFNILCKDVDYCDDYCSNMLRELANDEDNFVILEDD